ncbi:MAG: pilus assembly protein PilM [Phycisphaerales bacterium]|nr:pilus assembly protein PilM [Phycisphaerales bacterium]
MKQKQGFGKLGAKLSKGKLGSSLSTVGSMRPGAIPLAIEFGVSGIKALQLSGSNPSSITSAAFLPTPDDLLDSPAKRMLFQMDALPKFLKGEKMNAARATSLIPSGQMICKHLQIIPTEGVPIEQIAGAQLSTQLGCAPAELLVRCRVVKGAKTSGKIEVICFAASREFVGRIMGSLKAAKLEPVGIHTEFDAMARAVQLRDTTNGSASTIKPTLILDLGTGSIKAMIVHGIEMVFARTIEIGARHLDESICHQLRCTMFEARQMREGLETLIPAKAVASAEVSSGLPGMPPPAESSDETAETPSFQSGSGFSRGPEIDLSETLEIITDEVSMCLRYHNALFPAMRVERLIFLGGQAKHQSLCSHLARALNLEAQVLDPLACLARTGRVPTSGIDLHTPQPGWATVVGGALSPMDL